MSAGPRDDREPVPADVDPAQTDPAEVELLPLPARPDAYLVVERALHERLGLDGP